MAIKRLDHVSVVVDDLPAAVDFFNELSITVESVDDTVARLRRHGGELIGEIEQYADRYKLCYTRGPAGIIVSLAEELS